MGANVHKVVILAGGLGTRLSEETAVRPKPMVEIGSEPIIWHIMKIYSAQGFNDFLICAGYKQNIIKEYFSKYVVNHSDIDINFKTGNIEILTPHHEDWNVKIVDTGMNTMTGGRLRRVRRFLEDDDKFLLTYGDGLSNVRLESLLNLHNRYRPIITATAVKPPGRFGALSLDGKDMVREFTEKPPGDRFWINGGYYAVSTEIFDYIKGDETPLEKEPLETIAKEGKMRALQHRGFWKSMDTMTDKRQLEELWNSGKAPWKVWND